MKRPLSFYIGNIFIFLSLLGFFYIGYPLILAYFFPPAVPSLSSESFTLWIPKINAGGTIIPHVDPWDERIYRLALKKGIAHAKGFALPGEKGTIFLFAHSSGPFWEQTRYNTVFLRLGELEKGDSITIWKNGKEYKFSVTGKKEVSPTDVMAVMKSSPDQLILQTCTPIGTDWKRLLVFATKKN